MGEALAAQLPDFALIEIDRVRVVGRDAPEHVFALIGNRKQAADLAFQAFTTAHSAMLTAYRAMDWFGASAAVRANESEARRLGLGPVYALYAERISTMIASPPSPDWDGVYAAVDK